MIISYKEGKATEERGRNQIFLQYFSGKTGQGWGDEMTEWVGWVRKRGGVALCWGVCFNKEGGWYVQEGEKCWARAALRCYFKWKWGFEGIIVQSAPFSTLLAKASWRALKKDMLIGWKRCLFAQYRHRLLLLWSPNICDICCRLSVLCLWLLPLKR